MLNLQNGKRMIILYTYNMAIYLITYAISAAIVICNEFWFGSHLVITRYYLIANGPRAVALSPQLSRPAAGCSCLKGQQG